jgi:hypothetical protein
MAKVDPLAVLVLLGKLTEILTKVQDVITGGTLEQDFNVKNKGHKYHVDLKITKVA